MARREPTFQSPFDIVDFHALVEESLAGIYVVQEHRFVYVNRALAAMFGYTPSEMIGRCVVEDLVVPEDRERVLDGIRRSVSGTLDVLHCTCTATRRDGSFFHAEARGRRTSVSGSPAVSGTLQDVSERVKERERLAFLARATELLDSSLDYENTLEGIARLMIPSFADLCLIDILEGEKIRRLSSGHAELDGEDWKLEPTWDSDTRRGTWIERILDQPGGLFLERVDIEVGDRILSLLPPDRAMGTVGIQSLIVVPLIARGRPPLGAMSLATTHSRRRYGPEDLRFAREVARSAALHVDNAQLYREAHEAIGRRQDVLAVVSHDLRNPLNVILMTTAMGLDQDRRRRGPLTVIHDAAKQMERLICDLLDLAAIEAGGFSVDLRPTPLAPLVERCLALLQPTAAARNIHLINEVVDTAVEALVDEDRLVQALCNLIGNAIKFSPDAGTVTITSHTDDSGVTFSVRDEGPGIPEDHLERVFDRFWRVEKTHGGGAGLGLAIVRGIAVAHGGTVHAESVPGGGAVFHLRLRRPI